MPTDSSLVNDRSDISLHSVPGFREKIFPAILNTLEEPLFLLDDSYKLVWHNTACDEIYYTVSGRHLGVNFDFNELLTKEQQPLFMEHLATVTGGQRVHFEWKYQMAVTKWLSVSLYPFLSGDGKYAGICGSLRDITEKKLNELALQQALRHQDYINAVINNIPEGVLLIDNSFRILTFNRRAIHLFGRINTIVQIGDSFIDLLPEHRKAPARQYLTSALSGVPVEYEVAYDDSLWLFINYMPVKGEDGTIQQVSITFRDITERKKAEEQIRADEIKYRALVNSLSEGVILQTLDKQILTINHNAAAILGMPVDELKEKGFPYPGCVLVDEHEKEITHEGLFYKTNGKLHAVKNKIIGIQKKNGIQWLKLNSGIVTHTPQKEPHAIVISFQDITERKRILGEMEVLALLARETVNAVCILHPNGEMLWMNEGFTRLTGYSAEELMGKSSRAFLNGPETDMAVMKKAAYCRENGLPMLEEFLIYTKKGKKVWTRAQGQAIRQANSAVANYFLIVTDITEEKKILEELEVLSLVARETNNGVVIFDKQSGNTIWVNEGFTRLTGFTAEDIIGKNPVATIQGPETDLRQLQSWADRISNDQSYSGDLVTYTKDGQKRIHHITGQPLKNKKGEITRYFAIGYDITERRRMEEERLQNEIEQQKKITGVILQTQEVERNQLGRELHDNINQILAAIRMQLSFSLDNFSICKPILIQCRENIMEALEETRRLSHRMVMPRFSERALPQALKALADNYQYTQAIVLETGDWSDDRVAVSIKETFFRISQEQLSNIYKHAKATQVTIRIRTDLANAMLSVEDNGVGFDPTEKKGGIGISNIRSRTEFQGGTAQFISAPGKGCALFVNIPLAGVH
ncbi:PAS domain S-box protein [Flavitalea sp. BT771]|uniref:PAS domain-containing sensor histidine kinase n=1 Tax=Flavitalea sp. BT771 TaxID=3063329 RepID=UPI0026E2F7E0|nr:PAS domain S-box protein [Flavitalea sp. BT771]MDO6431898.1 PAS domain S-box protein [Flavitalea sp. BT771]MDV6220807.1 PAS domain S-box protein [Flavitalea sp. BT771]